MIVLKYDWEHAYVAAILETDDENLVAGITRAKDAMLSRIARLNANNDEAHDERASVAAALIGLHKMRMERMHTSVNSEWASNRVA